MSMFKTIMLWLSLTSLTWSSCPYGMYLNKDVNRCVQKNELKQVKKNILGCEKDEESCSIENTIDKTRSNLKDNSTFESKNKEKEIVMFSFFNIASSLLSVFSYFLKRKGIKGACYSTHIMAATSLYGHFMSYKLYKNLKESLEKIKTEFEKSQRTSTDRFREDQILAFDYLEYEQGIEREYAREISKKYKNIAIGYYLAASVAAFDIVRNPGCGISKEHSTSKDKFLTYPMGILISGSIAGSYALYISKKANKDIEAIESNLSTLEKIKKTFIAGSLHSCIGERENLNMPYCYCYLKDGEKNPNRNKS